MGLDLNDHLDYTHTASTLAAAGSRALGGITHKYFALRGMDFAVYRKLFDSCVVPVLNYGSEIWGYKCDIFGYHKWLQSDWAFYYPRLD